MHDTMTVTAPGPSRDAGWGNVNGFGDYNGGGSSGTNGSTRSSAYAVAALSMARPGIPALVFPVNGILSTSVNIGMLDTGLMSFGNYINNSNPLATRIASEAIGLARFGARFAGPVAAIISMSLDLEAKRQDAVAKIEREAIEKARKEASRVNVKDLYQIAALPAATLFVGSLTMDQLNAKIRGQNKVVADVVSQPVVDTKTQQRQMSITRNPTSVPVVKAEKTHKTNVYSAQIVAGMKPMQIRIDNSKPFTKNLSNVNTAPTVGIFSPIGISDTHHAILDFDGKHEPMYISVSKVPTLAEEKAQLEETKIREREWLDTHPLEKAALELIEAIENVEKFKVIENEKQQALAKIENTPEGLLLQDADKYPFSRSVPGSASFYGNSYSIPFTVSIENKNDLDNLFKYGGKHFTASPDDIDPSQASGDGYQLAVYIVETEAVLYDQFRQELLNKIKEIDNAKNELNIAIENRKKAEAKKKEKEQKVEEEKKKESARNEPGTVTGNGEDVGDNWLNDVSNELGSPIPKSVADKLRGKKFSSFDKLREAIWKAVEKDPKLKQNIKTKGNKKAIEKGKAPFARKKDQVGGRKKLELHHVDEIQHGGEVYNVDNLRIVTPKNHINIHSK
ncbi:colicin-like bacteriocin tRNase domain-containing protein [Xenorhabdus sp. PR6a]|uniref:colicin-like bacteriocin tRNase domain-containing protein n=1 Tax=Xenorhabdus sp. PR6a TaxID=3025877 RepID=UPI002358BDAA|nr:colicin-like bacteriocin tRNase domain-containing protein [Xenorhabdus sp. PR6a]MDC9582576.1 colicin-like bacteriocin tRNase domain-containing protein [Xenorhabdus sp. PR6a]